MFTGHKNKTCDKPKKNKKTSCVLAFSHLPSIYGDVGEYSVGLRSNNHQF